MEQVRPEAIATLAYEGGHPDHDSCSLLAARLGERFAVPVWETAVYSRQGGVEGGEGELRVQRFLRESGEEAVVEISEASWSARGQCARNISRRVISADIRCPA